MGITAWLITDGEIDFSDNTFTEITGTAALAQRLEGKLEMLEGEWEFDLTEGIDWPDILSSKPYSNDDVEPELRETLSSDPAVTGIIELTLTPNNETRKLEIFFKVSSDVGLVEGGVAI